MPEGHEAWSGTGRDRYVDFATLLSNYLLSSQCDRVAMVKSVEGRYPFLDHTLIEFASQLLRRYLLCALREKGVLRDAVADLLPPSIGERTKQPYRAPDSASFFVDGKPLDYVAELFSAQRIAQRLVRRRFNPASVCEAPIRTRIRICRQYGLRGHTINVVAGYIIKGTTQWQTDGRSKDPQADT